MVEDKVTGKRMIAHINASGKIQTVKSHSEGTACLTQQFAEEFGCGKQGYFCGLLHDIGKYSEAFQRRIADPENAHRYGWIPLWVFFTFLFSNTRRLN